MSPTLAQNRGYIIRDFKKCIQHLNLSIAKINIDKDDLKKQMSKAENMYASFTKIDEDFVKSLENDETALKTADAQSEEIYNIFLEASNRVKSVFEQTVDKSEDSHNFQTASFRQRIAPKPMIFTGNSADFLTWSAEFKDATMHLLVSEKFQLLKQYTGGRAREAIQPFLYAEHSEKTFINAFSCLKERFGDDDLIADHYLQKLENWNRVDSGDSLQEFVDFLRIILALSYRLPALDIVNSKLFNKKMMAKLPKNLQDSWIEYFVDSSCFDSSFPTFSTFVEFLEKKALIANHPHTQSSASHKMSPSN